MQCLRFSWYRIAWTGTLAIFSGWRLSIRDYKRSLKKGLDQQKKIQLHPFSVVLNWKHVISIL